MLQNENYISFIGYWGEKPVATAALILDKEVAGVYLIITKPEYRGKRIGSAMTVEALKYTFELGYQEAIYRVQLWVIISIKE